MKRSVQFRCPHCKAVLTKCVVDQVLGEANSFLSSGPSVETCPACGGTIDRMSIVTGKYDVKNGSFGTVIGWLIFMGVIIWLISKCS